MNNNQTQVKPAVVDADCPQHPERVDTEILLMRIPRVPTVTPTVSGSVSQGKKSHMKRANTEKFLTPKSPYDPFARVKPSLPGSQSPTVELVNKYFNSVPTPSTGFRARGGRGSALNSAVQPIIPPPPDPKRIYGIGRSSSHCFQQQYPSTSPSALQESKINLVAVKPSTAKTHTAVVKKKPEAVTKVPVKPRPLSPLRVLPVSRFGFGPTVLAVNGSDANVEPRHPVMKAGRRQEDEFLMQAMEENAQNNNSCLKSAAEGFLKKNLPTPVPNVMPTEVSVFATAVKYMFNGSELPPKNEKAVQTKNGHIEKFVTAQTSTSQDGLELSLAWKNTSKAAYRSASSESETSILKCPTKVKAQVHLPAQCNESVPMDKEYRIEEEPSEIRHSVASRPKTARTPCSTTPQGSAPRGFSIENASMNTMLSTLSLPDKKRSADSLDPELTRDCATLRVNNLEDSMGYEDIKALFPKCCSITYPMYDRSGPEILKPIRYCFVLFNDSEDAHTAFQKMDGYELRGDHAMALDIEFRQYIS